MCPNLSLMQIYREFENKSKPYNMPSIFPHFPLQYHNTNSWSVQRSSRLHQLILKQEAKQKQNKKQNAKRVACQNELGKHCTKASFRDRSDKEQWMNNYTSRWRSPCYLSPRFMSLVTDKAPGTQLLVSFVTCHVCLWGCQINYADLGWWDAMVSSQRTISYVRLWSSVMSIIVCDASE